MCYNNVYIFEVVLMSHSSKNNAVINIQITCLEKTVVYTSIEGLSPKFLARILGIMSTNIN